MMLCLWKCCNLKCKFSCADIFTFESLPCLQGYSRKGLAEFNLGRVREAEATYTKGLTVDPTNESLQTALNEIKQSEASMREVQAMIAATQAVRSHPRLQKYSQEDPEYLQKLVSLIGQVQANPSNLRLIMAQPVSSWHFAFVAELHLTAFWTSLTSAHTPFVTSNNIARRFNMFFDGAHSF